ncbi:hypothetical protein [Streptomyces sp. NPDC017435]|uniref:hypothetical protein n=1 Tax=Streptomyces sp. NPDC017435 TaxID=3364995 RepID=UPI0037AE9B18
MSSHDRNIQAEPEASYCPYPLYSPLRERDVTFVEEAGAFMVTRAEDVDTVLRDVETFSSRDIIGRTPTEPGSGPAGPGFYLIDTDAPEHSRFVVKPGPVAAGRRHRSGLHRVQGSSPAGRTCPEQKDVSGPASVTRPGGRARCRGFPHRSR